MFPDIAKDGGEVERNVPDWEALSWRDKRRRRCCQNPGSPKKSWNHEAERFVQWQFKTWRRGLRQRGKGRNRLASCLPLNLLQAGVVSSHTDQRKAKAKNGPENVGSGSAQDSLKTWVLIENKNLNLRSNFETGAHSICLITTWLLYTIQRQLIVKQNIPLTYMSPFQDLGRALAMCSTKFSWILVKFAPHFP